MHPQEDGASALQADGCGTKAARVYSCYLLASAAGSRSYCGVTTDLRRRLLQHNGGLAGGALSLAAFAPPCALVV